MPTIVQVSKEIQKKLDSILEKLTVLFELLEGQQSILGSIMESQREYMCEISQNTKSILNLAAMSEKQTDLMETQVQTMQMVVQNQNEHLSSLVNNTLAITEHIRQYGDENQRLIGIIAGKKQVPLSVFIIVLLVLSVGALLTITAYTEMQLFVDSDSITIKQEEQKKVSKENNIKLERLENLMHNYHKENPNVTSNQ